MDLRFLQVDIFNEEHSLQLIRLLDFYMQDEMGNSAPMPLELAPKIIEGLKKYPGYIGFFVIADGQFAALANCNKNFSTFKAMPLINIHDFIVHPDFRGKGVGRFLLDSISRFFLDHGYCRINLEVRYDNLKAQKLYKDAGYSECNPPMFFWERQL